MKIFRAFFICLICGVSSIAKSETAGSWFYETNGDTPYAGTVNDSGNIFGQWCFPSEGSCIYLIALATRCDENSDYPVLINSDSGASSATLICRGKLEGGNLYRYAFSNFDAIDRAVRASKRIGIATPLEGDQFRVFRFSLDGASPSLKILRDIAEKMSSKKTKKTTKDVVL